MDNDDPEIKKIMQRKMQDMINQHNDSTPSATKQLSTLDNVINLSSTTSFNQTISLPQLVLVDFWAEWCGPCKAMHHAFEEANLSYPDITFARVNVDACPDIAAQFRIQSIPTFIMFKSGKVIDTVLGAVDSQGIHAMCQKHR